MPLHLTLRPIRRFVFHDSLRRRRWQLHLLAVAVAVAMCALMGVLLLHWPATTTPTTTTTTHRSPR